MNVPDTDKVLRATLRILGSFADERERSQFFDTVAAELRALLGAPWAAIVECSESGEVVVLGSVPQVDVPTALLQGIQQHLQNGAGTSAEGEMLDDWLLLTVEVNAGRRVFAVAEKPPQLATAELTSALHPFRSALGSLYALWQEHRRRHNLRAELSRSELFLHSIIENLPNMIFVKDAEQLRFVLLNRAGEELIGMQRAELLGKNDFDLFPREQAEFFTMKDREVLTSGKLVVITEEPIETVQHGERLLRTKKIPLFGRDHRPLYLLGISEDITDSKLAERQLVVAKERAEEGSRAKSQFVANISHELRTPLHGVLGVVALLLETSVSEEQRELLHIIRSSSDALLGVINDVLDLSRVEAGKLVVNTQPVDVHSLLDQLRSVFSATAEGEDLTFVLSAASDVPEVLLVDRLRLNQILFNLLANAVKFTHRGAVLLLVHRAQAENGSPEIRFHVVDTGVGLDNSMLDAIFEPFEQVDNSFRRDQGGTGLGLTISRRLAELMGGRLAVRSARGVGSVFTLSLPLLMPPPENASAAANTAVSSVESPVTSSPLAVLLVEDNPVNQRVALGMLTREGHTVTVAGSGDEALTQFRAKSFDVVLMDIQMPGLDGITAAEQIRELEIRTRRARTPIVAVTAHAMASDRDRCLHAGMDGYLAKPFRPEELRQALRAVLRPDDSGSREKRSE